jgi:fructose/tagatose bisphosphate aldolase
MFTIAASFGNVHGVYAVRGAVIAPQNRAAWAAFSSSVDRLLW